ncbi:MAG: Bax inhibitor-1 family protein [Coriobacteriales bacterium]|nr:Bax inhibitor-1 family protein [Coriobacteriales bacterium]
MDQREVMLNQQQTAPIISRRLYNLLTFGLVTVSFVILWGTYLFASGGGLERMLSGGAGIITLIVSFIATIAGIVLMSVGKKKQSVGLSLAGYVLFSLTFGISVSLVLERYNIGTISYAFGITACIAGIFLVAGVTFPNFFARIGGILCLGLIATIVVEFVAIVFLHADQTIFDYIVIVLFCGFLGYDSYLLAVDDPTVPNAIFHASNIYLDIVNILLRVLDLLDNK